VPISRVTVPPFFALPELPEDELEELPHAASTMTAPAATTAVKADLEILRIDPPPQRFVGPAGGEIY
jgi:hypothetical protein